MKKNLWKFLLAGLVTGVLVFAMSLTASGSESLAATSTRWPTSTRRPTDTRWPTSTRRPTSTRWVPGPTNTRQPSATPTATKTRLPTITRPATNTRWPTIPPTPTQTRWPSRTPSPTRTRISSPTPTPIIPSGWQVYQNPIYGFQFSYPRDASITAQEENHVQIYMTITTGTNLVSKYLEVYAREDSGDCGGTYGGTTSTYVVINGYTFLREEGRDQGAGQIHEWVSYSTAQARTCITFSFILHSGNPDNYSPPVPLFDKAAESAIFAQIMGTFGMLPATPTPTITPTPSITPTEVQITSLPIRDFNTVVSGEFKLLGYMNCSDVASFQWYVEPCNGESGGCWISRTPLFGVSYSGFLRWEGNKYCGWNIP